MNKKTIGKGILNIALYLIMFLLINMAVTIAVGVCALFIQGMDGSAVIDALHRGALPADGKTMAVTMALTGVLTALLFIRTGWTPVSRTYLQSRPWAVLCWVVVLALGTVIPSEVMQEQMGTEMPEQLTHLFVAMLREPWGYLAIGIMAPLAEEVVFRGAVLRTLLTLAPQRLHWVPIVLSAVLFGAVHGNAPQFVHATLMGLLLGWLYYRTGSLAPGMVLHWANNTVAYVVVNLLPPSAADAQLIDLFGGSGRTAWLAVLFSLCLAVPALFQLAVRMRRRD